MLNAENTLGCLDQYTCNMLRLKQSGPWNSLGIQVHAKDESMKQSRLWSSLGTYGSLVVKLSISSSGETWKFHF